MRHLACSLLLAALAVLTVPARSLAQAAAAPATSEGEDAEARSLYAAGQVAFREGRFENALDYFERAYALSHRAGLLYNVGTTQDRLRRDAEALAAFERYLAELPEAQNRGEVEARIVVLREAIARQASSEPDPVAEPTVPATTPRSSTPSQEPNVGAWVMVGAGGAAIAAGVVLLALAASDVASVEGSAPGSMWSAVRDAYGRSEAESIAGAVLLGVGGAAAIAGIVWAVLPGEGEARVELAPSASGLILRGVF